MRREPTWLGEAARLLASGSTVSDAAKAAGVSREALSRRLHAPGSSLAAEVERRRGQLATEPSDRTAALLEQALGVLARGLTSTDDRKAFDSAKAILAKLGTSTQVVKVEAPQAEPVTADAAVRELAHALADAPHLVADGGVSADALALLADAAGQLVAQLPPGDRRELAALPVPAPVPMVGGTDAQQPQLLQ